MSTEQANYPIYRDSAGQATNAADDFVAADTGAVADGGIYSVLVTLAQTALARYAVERRNAANDAAVGDVSIVYGAANTTNVMTFRFELEKSQRVRVRFDAAQIG